MKILPNIFGQGELYLKKKANSQQLWDNSRFNLHKAAGLLLPWECLLTVAFPGFGQNNFSLTFSNILFFTPPLIASMELKHALQSHLQLHFFLLCFTGPNWKPLLILCNNVFGWILKFAAAVCACTEEKPSTWFLIFPRPKITPRLLRPWRISLISELETRAKMKSAFQNI